MVNLRRTMGEFLRKFIFTSLWSCSDLHKLESSPTFRWQCYRFFFCFFFMFYVLTFVILFFLFMFLLLKCFFSIQDCGNDIRMAGEFFYLLLFLLFSFRRIINLQVKTSVCSRLRNCVLPCFSAYPWLSSGCAAVS